MEEQGYTFFMENSAGQRATFVIEYCRDPAAAAAHAHYLLKDGPYYRAIEVFDGQNSFRVERRAA